jgi:hypothetical protein
VVGELQETGKLLVELFQLAAEQFPGDSGIGLMPPE